MLTFTSPGATIVEPNAGGAISASTFDWPSALGLVASRFIVTDTGSRRVLVWDDGPEPGQPADAIRGQDAAHLGFDNRGAHPPRVRSGGPMPWRATRARCWWPIRVTIV